MRGRLSAMRAHPSCGDILAERISGVLLVLDVVALTGLRPRHTQKLAG